MENNNLTLHVKMFSDKVKLMNQTGKQNLTLSAQEARNLQSDIFDLLAFCTRLSKQSNPNQNQAVTVGMDGGMW
tara:strand:+ start:567 stop:788 length:222 start_codon:yes stop_codon:yes gene_type:complete